MSTEDEDHDDLSGLTDLDDDDDALGAPIDFSVLASAAVASTAFYERLRRRIERRQVTADFATLFWSLPGTLLRGVLEEGRELLHRPLPGAALDKADEETPHG
ncbi:MAG: hypothetical protein H6706_27540 [Myxococcales bacterium]|nr:hypothetical protein [Myxococcales bacterium]